MMLVVCLATPANGTKRHRQRSTENVEGLRGPTAEAVCQSCCSNPPSSVQPMQWPGVVVVFTAWCWQPGVAMLVPYDAMHLRTRLDV